MEKEFNLKPIQEEILDVVEKCPGLSIKELASELRESVNLIWNNVNILEFQLNLLETWKTRGKRKIYLKNKALINGPASLEAKLMEVFSLDELEVRISLEAQSETFEEVADELGELPMQVRARITSIPAKLKVGTLSEARRKIEEEAGSSLRQ